MKKGDKSSNILAWDGIDYWVLVSLKRLFTGNVVVWFGCTASAATVADSRICQTRGTGSTQQKRFKFMNYRLNPSNSNSILRDPRPVVIPNPTQPSNQLYSYTLAWPRLLYIQPLIAWGSAPAGSSLNHCCVELL